MSETATRAGERLHAGAIAEFTLDKFKIIETGGISIGVVRTSKGFFAVANRCPHMGAPVCVGGGVTVTMAPTDKPFHYEIAHDQPVVRCPWHRWEFRVDTGENIGPVTRGRLMTYAVEVEGEDVFVLRDRKLAKAETSQTGVPS